METDLLQPPENCQICQAPLRHLTGVSKKTGKPYDFWSCSAYPKCNFTWRAPSKEQLRHKEVIEALKIVNDNIKKLVVEFRTFAKIFGSVDEDRRQKPTQSE
jgi:ssDNA-binding Zn-finger/Zn-ribbon topoisomerase 1